MNLRLTDIDLGRLTAAFKTTFNEPTSDLTTSALVLGVILLVVLMIIMLLLLSITPAKRRVVTVRRYRRPTTGFGPEASDGDSAEKTTARNDGEHPRRQARLRAVFSAIGRFFTGGLLPVVLVVAALGFGYLASGTQKTCAQTCHSGQTATRGALEMGHAPCVGCHEERGLAGVATNVAARARMAMRSAVGDKPSGPALVDSNACMRCHRDVSSRASMSVRGIRMSHSEPDAAGMTCVSCHGLEGHSVRRDYAMSTCLPCHDGSRASSACSTCHVADSYGASSREGAESTRTLGSGAISYPVVRVGDIPCGGCHDEPEECDSCHGLRLPHSAEFMRGGHARRSAFERKKMCLRCHTVDWCSRGCHIGFEAAHPSDWKTVHAKSARTSVCGCHASRSGRTKPMCGLCHDF